MWQGGDMSVELSVVTSKPMPDLCDRMMAKVAGKAHGRMTDIPVTDIAGFPDAKRWFYANPDTGVFFTLDMVPPKTSSPALISVGNSPRNPVPSPNPRSGPRSALDRQASDHSQYWQTGVSFSVPVCAPHFFALEAMAFAEELFDEPDLFLYLFPTRNSRISANPKATSSTPASPLTESCASENNSATAPFGAPGADPEEGARESSKEGSELPSPTHFVLPQRADFTALMTYWEQQNEKEVLSLLARGADIPSSFTRSTSFLWWNYQVHRLRIEAEDTVIAPPVSFFLHRPTRRMFRVAQWFETVEEPATGYIIPPCDLFLLTRSTGPESSLVNEIYGMLSFHEFRSLFQSVLRPFDSAIGVLDLLPGTEMAAAAKTLRKADPSFFDSLNYQRVLPHHFIDTEVLRTEEAQNLIADFVPISWVDMGEQLDHWFG